MDPHASKARLVAELLACVRNDKVEKQNSAAASGAMDAGKNSGETAVAGHQKRDNKRFVYPVLRVLVGKSTYNTVDWSLGGLMCENYVGDLKGNSRIQVVVSDGSRTSAFYTAQTRVIRVDPSKRTLSLQFQNLSRGGFDWLSGLQLMQSQRK